MSALEQPKPEMTCENKSIIKKTLGTPLGSLKNETKKKRPQSSI